MKKYIFLIVAWVCFGFIQNAKGQSISNEGTDFWSVFPTHDPNGATNLANMNVFVTSRNTSEVTVSCGTYLEKKIIPANTVVQFEIPRADSYVNFAEGNKVLTNRGIHVQVTPGQPKVSVYNHVFASARSAATLILPKEALGQKYYSMNYTQDVSGSARNFLTLVASEDNTNLIIHETLGTDKYISLPKAGDVYEYLPVSNQDLTGVFVEVDPNNSQCKTFAAFSGSTSIIIGCGGSRDPLLQQLYTVNSWGKNYGVVPFLDRVYILRVLAQEDNTKVVVNGNTVTLNKGKFYESPQLKDASFVSADKLISVAQYSLTQTCTSASTTAKVGDPDMVLLNPVEFNIKSITVFSTKLFGITEKYMNVFMKTDKRSTFKLNGVAPLATLWKTLASNPAYSYIQITLPITGKDFESITMNAEDGFNAMTYGFGSAESYAYSAGTSLASNQYLTLVDRTTGEESSSACLGVAADFKMTLPYQLTKVVWKFGDETQDFIDNNPTPTKIVVNGDTLYTYSAPVNKSFATVGLKQITATGTQANSTSVCSGSEVDFIFNFTVDPLPTAAFTAVTESCSDSEITFTDNSNSNVTDKTINKWKWDFGDPNATSANNTSAIKNPTHIYTKAGKYTVKLYVSAENGCASEVKEQEIVINPKVNASYKIGKKTGCTDAEITFTDQSTAETGGVIAKWIWDMGDGKGEVEKTDGTPFTYTYSTPGEKMVTLKVISDKGCVSPVFTDKITIYFTPKADFELPDFCLADGAAVFKNKSTITDGTENGFTYLWDFGDPFANAQRPNTDNQKDPSHVFSKTGKYTIKLTVTSSNGCVDVKTQEFTVNGSIPKADFKVLNENVLCSDKAVEFEDHATVDFGEITKIEWYYDYDHNSIKPDFIDETPELRAAQPKRYPFTYPSFVSPATKTYRIRMVVYSGGSCVSEKFTTITVNAVPVVDFDTPPVCLVNGIANFADKSTIITANKNFTYVWNFGDENATAANNTSTDQNPTHAYSKAGDYEVTLTATPANGCSVTKKKTITISGSIPKPEFSVINGTKLCSSREVIFKDEVKVDFGEITRIDWYYDYGNDPSNVETDNNPGTRANPKTYAHSYPVFDSPASKTVRVRMVAYSGPICKAIVEHDIVLLAVPVAVFNAPTDVCLEAANVQLVGSEQNAMQGVGIFSGNGVSSTGVFNPRKAGVGDHVITFTYTANNGCTDQKTQTIKVNATPTVDVGIDLIILDGNSSRLNPVVSGNGLTYKWSPSEGLDHDDVLNPIATPHDDVTYTLIVKTDKGCIQTDNIFIKVLKEPVIPNTFTPNGDGINDDWKIKYLDTYPDATVEIYSRAGERVYSSRGYQTPFDGNFKGQPLPMGTYYYIISPNSGRKAVTGSLTIIR